jgi:hypothetical protein
MKEQVFKDLVMVFSGVVPLGTYAKKYVARKSVVLLLQDMC